MRETSQTGNTETRIQSEDNNSENCVKGVANAITIRQFVIFVKRSVGNVKKKGHTASQCKGRAAKAQYMSDKEDGSDSELVGHEQSIRSSYETICKIQLWMVPVHLNDKQLQMELDTVDPIPLFLIRSSRNYRPRSVGRICGDTN